MPLLNWSDSYLIGDDEIDCEHEYIFKFLNVLYETIQSGSASDRQLEEIIDSLSAFIRQHCANEEALLRKVKYPDYEEHRQQHRAFLRQIDAYGAHPAHTRAEILAISRYIMEWAIRHTLDSDMLYRTYLVEHNYAEPAKRNSGTGKFGEQIMKAGRELPTFYFDLTQMTRQTELHQEEHYRLMAVCHFYVRRIAPEELFIPMDNGFYFVVQTRREAEAAKLAQDLRAELGKLLFGGGAAAKGATGVSTERNKTAAKKSQEELEAETALRETMKPILEDITFDDGAPEMPPLETVRDGGFALKFMPMFNLKTGKPTCYLCGPALCEEGRTLFGAGITQHFDNQMRFEYDLKTLRLCLDVIGQGLLPKDVRLGVRVNFETLAWTKMRTAYQDVLREANHTENPQLGLLIDGIPAGTPCTRIAELVTFVRPFVKQVSIHLPERDAGMKWVGNMGVAGVLSQIPSEMTDNEVLRFAVWLKKTTLAQNAISILLGTTSDGLRDILRKVGIQYIVEPNADALSVEELPQALASPPSLPRIAAKNRPAAAAVA